MPIVAYLAVAVTVIEISGPVSEALLLPEWSSRLVTVLLMLGFPVVVVLAWVFDLTPEGVKKTTESTGPAADAETVPAAPAAAARTAPPSVRRVTPPRPPVRAASNLSPAVEAGPETDPSVPAAPPDPERVKRAALGHLRHELKTPINGILGYSEMMLEDLAEEGGEGVEEIQGDLEKIRLAGRRLLALIDEILSPGQHGDDDRDLDDYGAQIRADLRNPVNAVVGYAELLKETAEESGRSHLVPDLDRIETSARRLLELSTDIVQVATSHVEGLEAEGRLHEASALTRGVMSKARTKSVGHAEDGMGTLLVVDDNATNRDLLSRQLARAGYLVQTAKGGREALDLMRGRSFDLVLLDVIMPEVDGLDVLKAVKGDADLAATPVIMLSSLDDVESAIRCVELGAEDFLSKPFHPALLQARIGATLEVYRLRDLERGHQARLDEAERLADDLLRSVFPGALADRVRAGESSIVESYGEASVLWCDVERAARSHARDPGQIAGRMQRILETLDEVASEHGLEAMAPSGDGVVVAGGVPEPVPDHVDRVAAAALTFRDRLASDHAFDAPVRVGIDAGQVTGGVLGGVRRGFHLWGETVDLARMLGESAPPGEVSLSPGAFRLLKDRWSCASLGVQEIPGYGQVRNYRLEGPA